MKEYFIFIRCDAYQFDRVLDQLLDTRWSMIGGYIDIPRDVSCEVHALTSRHIVLRIYAGSK